MAVVVVNTLGGGNQDFYEQISSKVIPDGQLPAGCQVHIAGPVEGGWRVVSVWDSEDEFNQFRNDELIPAIRDAGAEERIAPKIDTSPVHRLITA